MPTVKQLIDYLRDSPLETPVFLTEVDGNGRHEGVILAWALEELDDDMGGVRLDPNTGLTERLEERMDQYDISQNLLARAMRKSPSQVSRWFTQNPARRVRPGLDTLVKIERTIRRLVRRREATLGEGGDG